MMPERRQEPEYEGEQDFLQEAAAEDDLQDQVSVVTLLAQKEPKEKKKDGSSLRTQLDAQLQQLFQLESTSKQRIYVEQLMESGIMLDALEDPASDIENLRAITGIILALLALCDVSVLANPLKQSQEYHTVISVAFLLCTIIDGAIFVKNMRAKTYSEERAFEKERMLILCKELDIEITETQLPVLAERLAYENKRRKTLDKYPMYTYDRSVYPKLIKKLESAVEDWKEIYHDGLS